MVGARKLTGGAAGGNGSFAQRGTCLKLVSTGISSKTRGGAARKESRGDVTEEQVAPILGHVRVLPTVWRP